LKSCGLFIDEPAREFILSFDEGICGIPVEKDITAAHVGIKAKGVIQEIAVGIDGNEVWAKPSWLMR
jgi:hypothetical protein